MDLMIGLFDDYLDYKEIHAFRESAASIVSLCDHTFSEEYDRLMQRLITKIEAGRCGTDKSYRMNAIWDTGSMISCISERMAQKMGLQPIEGGVGVTPTGQIGIVYYFLDVRISDTIRFCNVKVAGFPMKRHDAEFLIGMDIISKGDFQVRNEKGKTVIIFECADR